MIGSAYDLSPIGVPLRTKKTGNMKRLFILLPSAVCFLAFLILAPAAPSQSPQAEEKVIALAQQLKLTPQQEAEVIPILKAEAPKLEAIKNDTSLSGMQKVSQLRAIHSETSGPIQKILTRRGTNSCRPSARRM